MNNAALIYEMMDQVGSLKENLMGFQNLQGEGSDEENDPKAEQALAGLDHVEGLIESLVP